MPTFTELLRARKYVSKRRSPTTGKWVYTYPAGWQGVARPAKVATARSRAPRPEANRIGGSRARIRGRRR